MESTASKYPEYPPTSPPKVTPYPIAKPTDYAPKPREYQPTKTPDYDPKYPPKPEPGKYEPKYEPKYAPKPVEPVKYEPGKYAPKSEPGKYEPKYAPQYEPKYEPKVYVPPIPEPKYGPPCPEPQCGKTQACLNPIEVKCSMEETCFEITKCHKPAHLPCGKVPTTETYIPKYAHKPECADIIGKLKPEYDDPVKHVFERTINTSLKIWPHCTIGKIWVGENHNYTCPLWTGTGVLVGKDLLLTASHTAPWGRYGWWMRFAPGFSDGAEPFGSSYVSDIRGYHTSGTEADDFVVCKLFTPLGDTCGWMGTEAWTDDGNYTGGLWNMVGYSPLFKNGKVQFYEDNEKIKKIRDDGPFKLLETKGEHWGWDGGVLWGWCKDCPCVVGVLSGSEEECCIFTDAGWAGGPGLPDLICWAWTQWD